MLRYRNSTKYRSVWMALAALWILYYHSSLPPNYYSSFLGYVRFFGFSGVDILCLPRAWAVIIPLLATMTRLLFSKNVSSAFCPATMLC